VRSARRVQDEAQANRPNRRLQVDERITRIDSVLTSVDEGLMARAALKCRSYALALVNFEKRIAIMREHNITSTQEYEDIYESMHEIYAALDEPDGMQGISTLILSPSLEVQIRQHESTGNWTSAQSCWQLRIQESPSHLDNHIGYLRCLRNIGHYGQSDNTCSSSRLADMLCILDGLRTHVKGVLTRHPDWEASLAHFNVEGSWMVNDWAAVRSIVDTTSSSSSQVVLARLLLSIQDGDRKAVANAFSEARRSIGDLISKSGVKGHRQSYESLVDLHLVRDLEIIHTADARPNHDSKLFSSLASRLDSTLPTFRNRERILGFRRTAYKLRYELGLLTISTTEHNLQPNQPMVGRHFELMDLDREDGTQSWTLANSIQRNSPEPPNQQSDFTYRECQVD
jgi:serine/threonine-protein kinase ATR